MASSRIKIAVAGFQHETNTFAPHLAHYQNFVRQDGWPALTQGPALLDVMAGLNIPLAGFIDAAQTEGQLLHPLVWCAAEPSSYVTREAFERVAEIICEGVVATRPDAIYLDLHGAMVTEDFQDGEGELLRRLRDLVGADLPLVISLDLHANVTQAMLDHCSAMTIYRTYPHLDMAETGARAYPLLRRCLDGYLHKTMRKLPFLIPLTSQCTDFDPCRTLYRILPELSAATGMANIEFAAGFPPADIHECGAAVVAYGGDEAVVEMTTDHFLQQILNLEADFEFELFDADQAVTRAMKNQSDKPVVLADAQDNPGAGGTSDTTGILQALVRHGAEDAVVAVLYDPEVVQMAHAGGVGAVFDAELGGKSGFPGVMPFKGRFEVEALGDGRFVYTGAMQLNSRAELDGMALLRVIDSHATVRVVVGSLRAQCLDLSMIRHVGLEPTEQKIVVVKSTVHFRADFDPIAAETLVVLSPGANYCRPSDLSYQNLRPGVRLEPMGAEHKPA